MIAITGLILAAMAVVSCASTPRADVTLHESSEGGVYLERITDRNVQAAHPIKLDPALVARVLKGIHIANPKTLGRVLFADRPASERVFSDAESAFLAPLISTALSQAKADQQVRYRLVHPVSPIAHPPGGGAALGSSARLEGGAQAETTSGTLYAHGLSLHFTLSEYRHRVAKPDVIRGPNRYYPEQMGFQERPVHFTPQTALRPDGHKQSDGTTLVIDYEMLAKLPVASDSITRPQTPPTAPETSKETTQSAEGRPIAAPPTFSLPESPSEKTADQSEQIQSLKDLVIKKDMELEAVKQELRSTKRQLNERSAQLDALRKKGKASPKSPDVLP